MNLELLNARKSADVSRWLAVHRAWALRDVFAHPAYVRLCAGEQDEPLAAYAETASGFILYPFVLRPVTAPHLVGSGPPICDIISPYGYGGAFHTGADEVEAKEFWSAFDGFCRLRNVVSEFTRLMLLEDRRLPYPGRTEQKLVNVVRDLQTPQDEIWREFDHKVRKNVNKASRLGVRIEIDETGARLDDFLRIYEGTMDRRQARTNYYFPRTFFETILHELAGHFAFFHALHEERVVSTELVLVSADTLYSYLGGTERSAFDLRPNDLLKFEVMRWGQEHGKARFVLGGGYAPDDGIFRYKRAFAPDGLIPYSVGTRVFDGPTFARLLDAHQAEGRRRLAGWHPDPGFFPGYRQELPPLPEPMAS
ncbi:GNAT family N-acetyltransferase [Micromonospora sp. CPCC 205711]|uniref:GNAT family N-acetyltransferase n=1 Tax=Micromonospora sp. CPCC 205547 TaxID=3122400 RepID=UPI002FF434FE